MAKFEKTDTPGVWVRHGARCKGATKGRRCTCDPAWRGRRWRPASDGQPGKSEWGLSKGSRAEVLAWLGGATDDEPQRRNASEPITFNDLARTWLAGVEAGTIGKRRGKKSKGYSENTLRVMKQILTYRLLPEFDGRSAVALDDREWQAYFDTLGRTHSRSTCNGVLAVVRAIYGWAAQPTRRLVPDNPVRYVELKINDAVPRDLVLTLEEIGAMLGALSPADALPYAIAFGTGLRREEIDRLEWADVDLEGGMVHVRTAKSDAGENRWAPIIGFCRERLAWEQRRLAAPSGRVCTVSVMSSKLAERCTKAWEAAGVTRVTLHTGRHTYATHIMAAGYTPTQHQKFMGHADLQMTARYSKLLPPRAGEQVTGLIDSYTHAITG